MDDGWRIPPCNRELYGHMPGVQLEELQLLGDI